MLVRLVVVVTLVSGLAAIGNSILIEDERLDEKQRQLLWQKVAEADEKKLPKTAMEALGRIYDSAIADQDYPEAIRALARKYFTEGQINQPVAPYVIRKLGSDVEQMPKQVQPVMKVILANWFYSYYQTNRWRFAQRSQTSTVPSEDFETWDLKRVLNEIDRLFSDALAASAALKKIPITDYDELLEKGDMSDSHRPTLFDFLAFQALDFYSLDEQIIRRQGAFDVRADSPIFAEVDEFLGWEPKSDDPDSFLINALKLYQELLEFHQSDTDPTAFFDAELHRLRFGNSVAVGQEKSARYKAAMQRFADGKAKHPLSSWALYSLANAYFVEENAAKAHEIANRGLARFPESNGGKLCFNLIKQIEFVSLDVSTERVWNTDESPVFIDYRNLNEIHFRIVRFDYDNWRWGELLAAENVRGDGLKKILAKEAIRQWSDDLPVTKDFRTHRHEINVQSDLPSGCYLLIASLKQDFGNKSNIVSVTEFWKSNLSVVARNEYGNTMVSGQVFQSDSGKAVAGAEVKVSAWKRDGRNSRSVHVATARTDENGLFEVPGQKRTYHRVQIVSENEIFGYVDSNYKYDNRRSVKAVSQTVFFTDRAIYRPGQTVNFKGVCISSSVATSEYKTLPGTNVEVSLRDVNNEIVERVRLTANEFGSIQGSFNAPGDRATGRMRLEVTSGPSGAATLRVEEYKRPKFFVEVEKPEIAFNLNDDIEIQGNAKAYTGAAIDGAKVTWRVVREVRYPDWWMWRCWWCPPATSEAAEIANGEAETDVNGKFSLQFNALPDLSVERDGEPVFTYSVYADVTDTTGETRSDVQRIRIGYTSLQASLNCDQWQTTDAPVDFELTTSTHDGEGVSASGMLKIYRLKEPESVQRSRQASNYSPYSAPMADEQPDLSRIDSWPIGELVSETELKTEASGKVESKHQLATGAYKAIFETRDKSGNAVRAEKPVVVLDLGAQEFDVRIPQLFQAKSWSVEVGEEFVAFWGTGYRSGRAFVEILNRGKVLRSFWTEDNGTQQTIQLKVEEKLRGGFTIRSTYVRENRAYTISRRVAVPWSNKQLKVKWERFVSKLQPGQKETWTAVVSGPGAEQSVAEMVATMYDASLDAYASLYWPPMFNVFYQDHSNTNLTFMNPQKTLRKIVSDLRQQSKSVSITYRYFDWNVAPSISYGFSGDVTIRGGGGGFGGGGPGGGGPAMPLSRFSRMRGVDSFALESESAAAAVEKSAMFFDSSRSQLGESGDPQGTDGGQSSVDLSKISARKNLDELAFFFPNLNVDKDGKVRIEFTAPEALTQWKILGFVHDNELKSALLSNEAVTSKDLMVQPNPPRFLREGDVLEFSVKVSNQSATRQSGKVQLSFSNAANDESMDVQLGNRDNEMAFDIPAGQSKSLFWRLEVPDFVGVLAYRAIGGTSRLSDGEEGLVPVLSKRILVTESLPISIRGNQNREYSFDRLKLSESSDSMINQSYTIQMTSNPAWYAVMALPYLMEYPHQCSEQVFNRLYANSLGRHIVGGNPRIKRVFDQWRGTDALDSPLEKNEEIRNVLIAESPWLRDAKDESKARRDVAILFDQNRMESEIRRAVDQLKQMQYSDGSWPWFPGGRANDYITLYVTTGFGKLRHLGIDIDVDLAISALPRLDNWISGIHRKIVEKKNQDLNHLTPTICFYLYGRSFFLNDSPIDDKNRTAVNYFLGQAREYWPDLQNRLSQGQLAIACKRFGDQETPKMIMDSLTERSQTNDEMGMFWREDAASWWWYRAPIETQALLIEAYDEVLGDSKKVEECQIWLLKQKQTQNWKTTKATADATYALLMRGTDLLTSSKLVEVELGGQRLVPKAAEAGTGFYQQRFVGAEIEPEMADIKVKKLDDGIAWGSVHWQYLEDIGKIEPYEGTPLKLKKQLFIKKNSTDGPIIEPIAGPVQVGDQLVTRVEIRVDRDMEYVHLKDYRGSGTEPTSVLSKYKYQDGLAYYESTKDTASHFFIDYLPRGTYVFEYSVRVQHRGKYETGIAELQCMYAPEFNSHSNSVEIEVQ